MNNITHKAIIIFILSIILISVNGLQSAYAIDGSRFFTGVLLFSGIGASFAGAITQGQANEIYDDYLHSAIQKDMDKLIDDYNQKHKQSIIASRVGIGFTIGAMLISLFDAYNMPQINNQVFSNSNVLQSLANADVQNGEIKLSINNRF